MARTNTPKADMRWMGWPSGKDRLRLQRRSESRANLLVDNGSNFAIFSEYALILKEKWSDFDSAIRRFESSRPSQLFCLIAINFFTSRLSERFHSETVFRCPRRDQ
jgi:hypothetical protein